MTEAQKTYQTPRPLTVALLYGGIGNEREISLLSGKNVQAELIAIGHEVMMIDTGMPDFIDKLLESNIDVAFISLHGLGGEDGTIQGMLELMGIPYTGSGVMASALAMDKMRSKLLFEAAGLMTPIAAVLTSSDIRERTALVNGKNDERGRGNIIEDFTDGAAERNEENSNENATDSATEENENAAAAAGASGAAEDNEESKAGNAAVSATEKSEDSAENISAPTTELVVEALSDEFVDMLIEEIGLPCVVKPLQNGSSVGVTIVRNKEDIHQALVTGFAVSAELLVEAYIKGTEVTVPVIGNDNPEALPVIEIVPINEFYDYESKYADGGSRHIIPARLPHEQLLACEDTACTAFEIIGCRGVARADMIVSEDGTPWILELNTIPGMTSTSLLPDAARAADIHVGELYDRLIMWALEDVPLGIRYALTTSDTRSTHA